MMKIFNTETRSKEEVTSIREGARLLVYTCGPTVYNRAHLGNFRTYVFEDLLRRTLKKAGFEIEQVMNLTDVDDKTIKGALATGVDLDTYTEPFKKAFFKDLAILNIEKVEHYPAATHYIGAMVEMIETLIAKGYAYVGADRNVFFRINAFDSYGRLSHLDLSALKSGASERVDSDEYDKESVSDFVLWKAYDEKRDGAIYWESPWGKGRPGWHIECSAMARAILGDELDIHVGGVDNIFPHHDNEIAQSECCSGKCFSRYWMHSEHLIVDGKKMSKSLGNFYRLEDLLQEGYTGREIRFLLLSTHYRLQLNFTKKTLLAARASLARMDDFIYRLGQVEETSAGEDVTPVIKAAKKAFYDALFDDLNIAEALSALYGLIRDINKVADLGKLNQKGAAQVLALIDDFDGVLGFFDQVEEAIPEEVLALFEQRLTARKEKNWVLSDQLRDQILALGFEIEDRAEGARLKKKA